MAPSARCRAPGTRITMTCSTSHTVTGKQTRLVNGYAIRVDPAQADKMIEYRRQKLAEQE